MEFKDKNPKIYIVSGKARSGKNVICEIIKNNNKNKKVINLAYASYLKIYAKNILNWDGSDETKPREFLQNLGVELIKNKIDENLLVNRIIEDIKVYSYFYDIITISDARFPNEIDTIKKNFSNSVSIRVIKNSENNLTNIQKNHKSEVALNEYSNYDFIIYNNSTKEDLEKEVIKCIK